jgi:tRNA (guanine37-N1)-methyltransferase
MQIDVLTIFPRMFDAVLGESILKRAQALGLVKIHLYNLRDFSRDKHKKVDDRPFGGGPGMVLRPEPIFEAVEYIKSKVKRPTLRVGAPKSKVILLSPQGKSLDQNLAKRLSKLNNMILICGHYEGVDNRVMEKLVTDEISMGDYILTGGELAAMVLIDVVVRLIPGVLGDRNSIKQESFVNNLLEGPQYTRPANFRGMKVPKILLSGNHERIEDWRRKEASKRTRERRPDLLTCCRHC